MRPVHHLKLLDKLNRHHRRAMQKDPNLAAALAGAGRIEANGHLCGILPLVDGTVAVYAATPVTEWFFKREEPSARLKAHVRAMEETLSPSDRARGHIDAALNILAAIEKRAGYLDSHNAPLA
jgi:hypothetical protein